MSMNVSHRTVTDVYDNGPAHSTVTYRHGETMSECEPFS